MTDYNITAWALAIAGAACAVKAAYLTGGAAAAWAAAGGALTTAAGVLGWTGKAR